MQSLQKPAEAPEALQDALLISEILYTIPSVSQRDHVFACSNHDHVALGIMSNRIHLILYPIPC